MRDPVQPRLVRRSRRDDAVEGLAQRRNHRRLQEPLVVHRVVGVHEDVDRRVAVAIARSRVGAVREERGDAGIIVGEGGGVERGPPEFVASARVGAPLEAQPDALLVARARGGPQRGAPVGVAGVEIGAGVEERRRAAKSAPPTRGVKRGAAGVGGRVQV